MSSLAFFALLLAKTTPSVQATPTVQATTEAAKTVANVDTVWGTVITASVALFAALGGMLTGFIGGLTWVSNIQQKKADDLEKLYEKRSNDLEKLYNSNVANLDKSYANEKRSLELLVQQKESEISNLKGRIKRMEGFFSIHFPDLDKGNDILERLQLLLTYVRNKVQDDEKLCQEVDKMKEYLEGQLGLVDRHRYCIEAAHWIQSEGENLTRDVTEYLLQKSSMFAQSSRTELEEKIKRYLNVLDLMLSSGSSSNPDSSRTDIIKDECDPNYVDALPYIKDYKISGQISGYAADELQLCIDCVIEIVKSPLKMKQG